MNVSRSAVRSALRPVLRSALRASLTRRADSPVPLAAAAPSRTLRGSTIAAVACAAVGVAGSARSAHAQATITGTVRQPNGAPVVGASVAVEGQGDTVATDARGRFRLAAPAGTAGIVLATRAGFSMAKVHFAATADRATRDVTVVLPAVGQLTGVSVRGLAPTNPAALRPLLDSVGTTTGGSLSYAELRALPTDNRDPIALAFTVPGAAQALGFFDTAPALTLLGQNSLYTQYYLDGFDNNEGVLGGPRIDLPLSALRRLDVRTSNYDVTLGRSSNGVVNEETLAGGDAFHGEVFVYGRPGGSFDARQAVLPPNTSAGFRRGQFGGSVGGPLGSRTRAFAAAEYSDESQDQPIATAYGNATGSVARRHTKAYARVDQQWSATQSTTFHAALSDAQFVGRGGGVTTAEADYTQHRFGTVLGASHESELGGGTRNTFGAQVGTYHWYYPPTQTSLTTPQVTIASARNPDSVLAVVGASGFQYDSREFQVNLRDELTRQAGAHALTLGVDMIRAQFGLHGAGTNLAGSYTVLDNGSNIRVSGRLPTLADVPATVPVYSYSVDPTPISVKGTQGVYGAYAQDRWDVTPALTFTYGLRWDYDDMTSRGASKADLTNFQPRLALNYKADAQTVLRGGFGVYSQKLPYTLYSDAIQFGPSGNAYVTFYQNPDGTPLKLGQAPSAAAVAGMRATLPPREIRAFFTDGLKSPRGYQTTLGFQRTFGPAWGLSVDGLWLNAVHLPRLYDLNAVGRRIGPADSASVDPSAGDASRPVKPVNGSYRALTTTQTSGRSTYLALNVTGRHQFSEVFTADASYVLSRTRNNTEDINFASSNGANDFASEYADAINDRRHKLNVRGFYTLGRVRVSTVVDFQTGTPINRVSGRDLLGTGGSYGDGFIRNSERYYGVPRNGERLPSAFEINPGVTYLLAAPRGSTVELRAEAFNVLNRANYSGFPSGLAYLDPRTQVGRSGDSVDYQLSSRPRQLQFSARYVF